MSQPGLIAPGVWPGPPGKGRPWPGWQPGSLWERGIQGREGETWVPRVWRTPGRSFGFPRSCVRRLHTLCHPRHQARSGVVRNTVYVPTVHSRLQQASAFADVYRSELAPSYASR